MGNRDSVMDDQPVQHSPTSLFSLPLLCAGLALVGVCVLMPQIEMNRKLTRERDKLKSDLVYVQQQITVNDRFLQHVGADPALAERLAQRQMKVIREGTSVLPIRHRSPRTEMSPFLLVSVPPPPDMPAYHAPPGLLGRICRSAREQLYLTGVGMLMIAAGLVWGAAKPA